MTASNIEILKKFIKDTPALCGIYKMLNHRGEVIYVGKAKSLKSRLNSYTNLNGISNKTLELIKNISLLEIIVTGNEAEALLLESTLIKTYKPHFNILLKDDKSFPYIVIDSIHSYPKISKFRGYKNNQDTFYGPFTSPRKLDHTISVIQKAFLIRSCSDSFFQATKKPCILYQMKQCSAPCVEAISKVEYSKLVKQAKSFLSGKDQSLQKYFETEMNKSSEEFHYERAAIFRDRLKAISMIKSTEIVEMHQARNIDVIACKTQDNISVLQIFFIRAGKNLGNRSYKFEEGELPSQEPSDIISSFISKFYQNNMIPEEILTCCNVEDAEFLVKSLSIIHNKKLKITYPKIGIKSKLIDFALTNIDVYLKHVNSHINKTTIFLKEIRNLFNINHDVKRIEIYDNSHIQGTNAVGTMVVYENYSFKKSEYRKYNIKSTKIADDYHMLKEMLTRRFKHTDNLPDLMIIDGGLGHLSTTEQVLHNLNLSNLQFICIAKGIDRNSGNEIIYTSAHDTMTLSKHDKTKQFLQLLRDEAHRFAITSHRSKRSKAMLTSIFDNIKDIGEKRRITLLKTFGSLEALKNATIEEIKTVPGISINLAQKIYHAIHN